MFSKACEYAIRAVLFVALQSIENKRVSLKEIAREIDSPEAFTAKILQQLARNGIINSSKGPTGGFEIDMANMEQIKLTQLITSIDGPKLFEGCALGLSRCSAKEPCPIHERFTKIRDELKYMLETTTVLDLTKDLKLGTTILKR